MAHGFVSEGFEVAAGFDMDESCRFAFEENNDAPFVRRDVGSLEPEEIESCFVSGQRRVLVGCAPCQPFSTYNQKNADPKWQLVGAFSRLIKAVLPEVVSMENVPQLQRFQGGAVFRDFIDSLSGCGYHISSEVVHAADFGVPQTRDRLVLLASRLGPISLERPAQPAGRPTVRQAIGEMRPLRSGEADSADRLHRCSNLSPLNLRRVRASKPGGTWRDWDADLVASCHRKPSGRGYSSVYGRMEWDRPSPTITTQFYGFGNGRFGHPEQDRGLSLREGAILQSFPKKYRFLAAGEDISFSRLGKLIGNAVPVALARAIARSVGRHLSQHGHRHE